MQCSTGSEGPPTAPIARPQVVSSGVDWLTATAPRDGRDVGLLRFADGLIDGQVNMGEKVRPWQWMGYSGHQSGQVAYGTREDSTILRLSGDAAHDEWEPAVQLARRVTRLDFEVTVKYEPPDETIGTKAYRQMMRWRQARARAAQVSQVQVNGDTQSIYLGSRTSERYARLYDKHRETRDPRYAGCWRYEVESKGSYGANLARALLQHPRWRGAIQEHVFQHFKRHGHTPPFAAREPDARLLASRSAVDQARRLKWLQEQVQGVIAQLVSQGQRREVYEALGLSPAEVDYLMTQREGL